MIAYNAQFWNEKELVWQNGKKAQFAACALKKCEFDLGLTATGKESARDIAVE